MGWTIGLPSLKLNNTGARSKHCGNFGSVAAEALEERKGRDPDIDPDRAGENIIEGIQTAAELQEYSRQHVDQLRDAKGRKLRKDAVIMCATIVKPPEAMMATLSRDDQVRFLRDAYDCLASIVDESNVKSRAFHFDECGGHLHVFWEPMTADGRLCAKEMHNLQFLGRLNREMPAHLRRKGWDIEDCHAYDAAKEELMSDKEKAEKRRKNGRSSAVYKAEAERHAAKLREDVAALEKENEDLTQRNKDLEKENEDLKRQVAVATDQLQDVQAAVTTATQEVSDAQAMVEALGSQIKASETILGGLRDQTAAASALLSTTTQETSEAQAKVEGLNSQIEASEASLIEVVSALDTAQKQLDKVLKDASDLVAGMATNSELLYVQTKTGILDRGRVSLSQQDYDKVYKTAEAAVIMQRMADKASATAKKLSDELDRRARREREMVEEMQRTTARLRDQENELGLLRTLLRLVTELFKAEPEIYEAYRSYHYRRNDNEVSFGRMDWRLQEQLDLALGTNYAAEDKARYFAMQKQKEREECR